MSDPVNHPPHYTQHPSGVECIHITEHMGFCLGNAVKYIWRADLKHDAIEDLEKAKWYLSREIEKRMSWRRPCEPSEMKLLAVLKPHLTELKLEGLRGNKAAMQAFIDVDETWRELYGCSIEDDERVDQ